MKKSEESSEEPCDRLSELPDSIIFEIFGLLPTCDVVQTTILSKRWKNLWTNTPYLSFLDKYYALEFINRGCKILKFKILKKYNFQNSWHSFPLKKKEKSVYIDKDLWVRLAKNHGVEELYFESKRPRCGVPKNLYLCSSLKVLSLKHCMLQLQLQLHIHSDHVQWNQLRSLTIEECYIDDSINQVVSSCPQLEVFFLIYCYSYCRNLSIQSSSLKKLSIQDSARSIELRILSPNLETLDIVGEPYAKYSLKNVSSSTHLTLDFDYGWCCRNSVFEENLWQILQTSQHVENLTLSDPCIKVLGAMQDKYLILPSLNVKFLTLINKRVAVEYKEIVGLLQICPQLNTLVVQSNFYCRDPANQPDQVERNLPKSFLLQLRTVEITYTDGCKIFPFIEILLKHASNLQKMVFRGTRKTSMYLWSALQQKILGMPRSSPTAEFIFANY